MQQNLAFAPDHACTSTAWRRMILSACLLVLHGAAGAAGLAGLIDEAAQTDPSVLEAKARQEQAEMQTEVSKAGHWPVLGVSSTRNVAGNQALSTQFTGVTGKLNLFSGGAISKRVERDEYHQQFYGNKTQESRENVASTITQQYLAALRAKELLAAEQRNLQRHEKIISDLKIIVQHDAGREYELVQAESRALQVRMRMVQYEKAMRLALSKLTRYTRQPVTLLQPFPNEDWRKAIPEDARTRHPGIQAQVNEMKATKAELDHLKRAQWPSVDVVMSAGKAKGLDALHPDKYVNAHAVNLQFSWNFLDRSAYYSQQSAAKQLTAAQSRVDTMQRELDEKNQTAEADMAQSQLQAAAAQQQIGASARVVELYEMQFRIARRSLLELLNAYAELAAVETSKVVADNDYRSAVANYLDANAALTGWARMALPAEKVAGAVVAGAARPRNAGAVAVAAPMPDKRKKAALARSRPASGTAPSSATAGTAGSPVPEKSRKAALPRSQPASGAAPSSAPAGTVRSPVSEKSRKSALPRSQSASGVPLAASSAPGKPVRSSVAAPRSMPASAVQAPASGA